MSNIENWIEIPSDYMVLACVCYFNLRDAGYLKEYSNQNYPIFNLLNFRENLEYIFYSMSKLFNINDYSL